MVLRRNYTCYQNVSQTGRHSIKSFVFSCQAIGAFDPAAILPLCTELQGLDISESIPVYMDLVIFSSYYRPLSRPFVSTTTYLQAISAILRSNARISELCVYLVTLTNSGQVSHPWVRGWRDFMFPKYVRRNSLIRLRLTVLIYILWNFHFRAKHSAGLSLT